MNTERELEDLAEGLAQFRGYRSIWRTLNGTLCHAEPDEELEVYGYTLVATLLRPDVDTLREHVDRLSTPRTPSVLPRTPTVDVFPGFAHA